MMFLRWWDWFDIVTIIDEMISWLADVFEMIGLIWQCDNVPMCQWGNEAMWYCSVLFECKSLRKVQYWCHWFIRIFKPFAKQFSLAIPEYRHKGAKFLILKIDFEVYYPIVFSNFCWNTLTNYFCFLTNIFVGYFGWNSVMNSY